MPSRIEKIQVRSQIEGSDTLILVGEHKANRRGLKNAIRKAEWTYNRYYQTQPLPKTYYIWLEYKGKVLDFEKAKMALRGDFGVWGELEEILEEVVVEKE